MKEGENQQDQPSSYAEILRNFGPEVAARIIANWLGTNTYIEHTVTPANGSKDPVINSYVVKR